MRWAGVVVWALIAATLVAGPAQAATQDVQVRNNVFDPAHVRIQPGDTVRWTATDPDHTVTARDGRFDWHLSERFQQEAWTAGEVEEHIPYYCKIHAGMEGLITVGDPPGPAVPDQPVVIVPDDVATIAAAATGAQPGAVVLVRPGVYPEAVEVTVPELEIRGLGDDPGAVLLDGGHGRAVGVTVTAPGVRLANLAVARYRHTGVRVHGVGGTVLDQVHVHSNDLYGVDIQASSGVTLRAVTAAGHAIAGIGVRDCATCGLRVEHTTLERNAAGLLATHTTGLLVRHSTVTGNGVGVVLRDSAAATVTANTLTGNHATDVPAASVFTHPPVWTGAGVWIMGGRAHRVQTNTLTGHTYNIAVTGPSPVTDTRITHNTLDGAVHADLGIDTTGTGVCLTANQRPETTEPSSHPPSAHTLYDCTLPTTVTLPYPVVTTNLTAHALRVG